MNAAEFKPAHVALLIEQGGEAFASSREFLLQPGYAEQLRTAGPAWSAFDGDRLIGCGGIARTHPQLGEAWTLMDPAIAARRMVVLDRFARRILDSCPMRRIEANTDVAFEAGNRWLRMLGFVYEGTRRAFTPAGLDVNHYARVRS